MNRRQAVLQLIGLRDPEIANQIRILVEGLKPSRYQPVVAGPLSPRLRERLSLRDIPWVHLPRREDSSPQNRRRSAGQLLRLLQARQIPKRWLAEEPGRMRLCRPHDLGDLFLGGTACTEHCDPVTGINSGYVRSRFTQILEYLLVVQQTGCLAKVLDFPFCFLPIC